MIYTEHKITLDIHKTVAPVSVRVKKGDTGRRLLIHLAARGYPYHISQDCYAAFTAKKPDGKVVFNNCRIEECVIIYDLTAQTVAVTGLVDSEIILYGANGKQITSASFHIIVEDTIYDTETEIESTDEYNALAALIAEVQTIKARNLATPPIIAKAKGELLAVTDASNNPMQGLRIFGKSTQDGVPSPDNPVEIVNLGAVDGEISVYAAGKNLFANSETHAVDATGREVNNGAARRTPYIPVRPGQKLVFSKSVALPGDSEPNGMLRMFDENKRYVSSITALGYAELKKVVTIPDNIYFVRFVQYGFTYVDGLKLQMEIATAVTEYDSSMGQVFVTSTPNGLPGIPVSSGGNYTDSDGQQWICDEIDLARGMYVQRIAQYQVSSVRETSIKETTNGIKWAYGVEVKDSALHTYMGKAVNYILNNKFPMVEQATEDMESVGTIMTAYGHADFLEFRFRLMKSEYADKAAVEAAITGTVIYYLLAEPIETKLTAEEIAAFADLHSYKPNTTIYNDAGAFMAAEYVADTKTYVDRNGGSAGSAVRVSSVTLKAASWKGSANLYSQVVTIAGVTENSQVDLTPSVEQLAIFYEKDLTFVTENEDGVVTVYAIGQKPTNDYTIQVTITEVSA